MKKLIFFFTILYFGCSPIKKTSSGYLIEGESKIVSRLINDKLENSAIIEGYVYSRVDSNFIKGANLLVGKQRKVGTTSDESGHFKVEINPGEYDIEASSIGHLGEKMESLKIKKREHIMIVFELGTSIIY